MSLNIPFNPYKIYKTNIDTTAARTKRDPGKRILCFIPQEETEFSGFLTKVMEAGKIAEDQFQIFPVGENESYPLAELGWLPSADVIFCIGLPLARLYLHLSAPDYSPARIAKTTVVALPSLTTIQNSQKEKKELWLLIQKLFLHE